MKEQLTYVKTCPDCQAETAVIDSRENADGSVMRRRKCKKCGYTYRTIEIEESMSDSGSLLAEIERLRRVIKRHKTTFEDALQNIKKLDCGGL